MLDGLEQVCECIVVDYYSVGRLVHLYATRASTYELENGTYIEQETETDLLCFCGWE